MSDVPISTGSVLNIEDLAKNWWTVVLRGVLAIILGLIVLAWPGATIGVLVLIFGVFALGEGAYLLFSSIKLPAGHKAGVVLQGICSVVVGIIALWMPGAAALGLVLLLVAWLLIGGMIQLYGAFALSGGTPGRGWLGFAGALLLILGLLMLAHPLAGLFTIATFFGILVLINGILMLAVGFRLKSISSS